jgi:hypothetical protein
MLLTVIKQLPGQSFPILLLLIIPQISELRCTSQRMIIWRFVQARGWSQGVQRVGRTRASGPPSELEHQRSHLKTGSEHTMLSQT